MYRKRVRVIQFEEYIEREVREFYFYSSSTRLCRKQKCSKRGATKTHEAETRMQNFRPHKKKAQRTDDKRERDDDDMK